MAVLYFNYVVVLLSNELIQQYHDGLQNWIIVIKVRINNNTIILKDRNRLNYQHQVHHYVSVKYYYKRLIVPSVIIQLT